MPGMCPWQTCADPNDRTREMEKGVTMPSRPQTPQEALAALKEGNQRFVERRPLYSTVSDEMFANLRESQRPFAIILGCSDSRVPPELVFDQGFGDLFVI